jgi:hypothetical protein
MIVVTVESIGYRRFGDGKAIIEFWTNSITISLPRNCIAVNGDRFFVTDLRAKALSEVVKAIVIPYSLHSICGFYGPYRKALEYLV